MALLNVFVICSVCDGRFATDVAEPDYCIHCGRPFVESTMMGNAEDWDDANRLYRRSKMRLVKGDAA